MPCRLLHHEGARDFKTSRSDVLYLRRESSARGREPPAGPGTKRMICLVRLVPGCATSAACPSRPPIDPHALGDRRPEILLDRDKFDPVGRLQPPSDLGADDERWMDRMRKDPPVIVNTRQHWPPISVTGTSRKGLDRHGRHFHTRTLVAAQRWRHQPEAAACVIAVGSGADVRVP